MEGGREGGSEEERGRREGGEDGSGEREEGEGESEVEREGESKGGREGSERGGGREDYVFSLQPTYDTYNKKPGVTVTCIYTHLASSGRTLSLR